MANILLCTIYDFDLMIIAFGIKSLPVRVCGGVELTGMYHVESSKQPVSMICDDGLLPSRLRPPTSTILPLQTKQNNVI